MLGAIAGDIIGSVYEGSSIKLESFDLFSPHCTFTDDTVLTVAVADCIIHGKDYARTFKEYGRRYPRAGYGGRFIRWLFSPDFKPYNSFGNGSAMRVSPVGFAFQTLEEVLFEARRSAEVTHDHPEGIKGAQAVAAAVFLARTDIEREDIKTYIQDTFDYNLQKSLEEIRPHYGFDATCQGSVPQAITAYLESNNYEDSVRKAISLGGDSDTIACIAGGIAQAGYKRIPSFIIEKVREILPVEFLEVLDLFNDFAGLNYES